jgi:hypothetical protein
MTNQERDQDHVEHILKHAFKGPWRRALLGFAILYLCFLVGMASLAASRPVQHGALPAEAAAAPEPPAATLAVNSVRETLDPRWGNETMLAVSVTISRRHGPGGLMDLNTLNWHLVMSERWAYNPKWQVSRGECDHTVSLLPGGSVTCNLYFPIVKTSPATPKPGTPVAVIFRNGLEGIEASAPMPTRK